MTTPLRDLETVKLHLSRLAILAWDVWYGEQFDAIIRIADGDWFWVHDPEGMPSVPESSYEAACWGAGRAVHLAAEILRGVLGPYDMFGLDRLRDPKPARSEAISQIGEYYCNALVINLASRVDFTAIGGNDSGLTTIRETARTAVTALTQALTNIVNAEE